MILSLGTDKVSSKNNLSRPKVLFMASSLSQGLHFYFTQLAVALHQILPDLIVVTGSNEQEKGLFKRLKVAKTRVYSNNCIDEPSLKNFIKSMLFFKQIVDYEKVDIIHVQTLYSLIAAFLSQIFRLRKKPKLLVTVHSTLHGSQYERLVILFERIIWSLIADKVMPVSMATAKQITNRLLREEKVVVVHNGIDVDLFDSIVNDGEHPEVLADPYGKIMLSYSATLIPRKGHRFLIQAVHKLLKEYPCIKLVLTSNGPLKNELISLTKELGLSENVFFTGKISYPELYKLLSHTDIYVFPSLSELFPFAIIEAMAASKPIVATNVGGVSEAVKDGVNGYVVNSKNSKALAEVISCLIKNPETAKEMGVNGRKIVEQRFTPDVLARELTNIYEKTRKSDCRCF